jgi:hypothetical protein
MAGQTVGIDERRDRSTTALLLCGAVAAPIFIVTALSQAALRPGFDITRHAVSLLSNGGLGWIQIATFLTTGPLSIAGAVGMRRSLSGISGGRWAPALLAVFGAGLTGAGLFRADPAFGFPPGTPANATGFASWHGVLHSVCGGASFLALIAACFVLARAFATGGQRRSAIISCVVAVLFAAGLANGPGPDGPLTLFLGVSVAWLWVVATELRLIIDRPVVSGADRDGLPYRRFGQRGIQPSS